MDQGVSVHLVVVTTVPLLDSLQEIAQRCFGGRVSERRQPVLKPKLDDERRLPRPPRKLLGEACRLDLSGVVLQASRHDLERLRAVLPGAILVHWCIFLPQAESTAGGDHRVMDSLLCYELLTPPKLAEQRFVREALHSSDPVAELKRNRQRTRLGRVIW